MREIDTQTNELSLSNWSSHWVTDWTSHSYKPLVRSIMYIGFGFLSLVFARNSIVTGFHMRAIILLLQNGSRQEVNRKRVIQVIPVILRILLLPGSSGLWSKWLKVTKQIVFLVLRSVRSLISLIQVSKQIDP